MAVWNSNAYKVTPCAMSETPARWRIQVRGTATHAPDTRAHPCPDAVTRRTGPGAEARHGDGLAAPEGHRAPACPWAAARCGVGRPAAGSDHARAHRRAQGA